MHPLVSLEDPLKSQRNGQSKILSQQEYELLLGAVPPKYATLLRLCCLGGFRITEALSIRTEDLTETSVLVRKTNTKGKRSTREIPLPPDLVNELRGLEDRGVFLFESKHKPNHPITRQAADYIFRTACRDLGIEGWSLHGTRRFFVHTLHHKNVPLKVIQKAVGHSSLRSTAAYIDVEEHHIKDAVSLLWSLV
jgi:integrase/recombinase XerD